MRHLPPLATLRAFEAAARHQSFKKAADELGVTPTAVSHQIRLLEETLGSKLFERKTRHVVLTSAGQLLYPALRDSFDRMAGAVAAVSVKSKGAVTITTTMVFASKWLAPRIARFAQVAPDIAIRILATDDVVELATGAADLAIRYGSGPYKGYRSDLLLETSYAPICSPQLGLKDPAELRYHPLVHFDWRSVDEITPSWARWFAEAGLPTATAGQIVFSDETHAIQAAAAGQGVALANLSLVVDEFRNGILTCPFGPRLSAHNYHLIAPDRGVTDPTIDAVCKWLIEEANVCASTNA